MVRTRNKRTKRRITGDNWFRALWSVWLVLLVVGVSYQAYLRARPTACAALAEKVQKYDKLTDILSALVTSDERLTQEQLDEEDEGIQTAQKLWEEIVGLAKQCR